MDIQAGKLFPVESVDHNATVGLRMDSLRSILWRCAFVALGIGLLSGCEELEVANRATTNAIRSVIPPSWYNTSGYWKGTDVPGRPRIVVHLSEQKAYFYKGRHLIGESTVSTGKPGFSTPPGHYTVLQKDKNHLSSIYGDYIDDQGNVIKTNIDNRKDPRPRGTHFDGARMPYFMRFRGGYGMHAGYVPPFRASHGCIRLPERMARRFFNAAHEGTPVIVKE
jgi:L,D-transpeptidase catalytic domain